MWIYPVFVLLLSEAWSMEPVVKHSAFNLKSDVILMCSDKTWNETIFVIWNISLKYKDCKISSTNEGQSRDSCNDGKALRNTSSAQSYLHIPNFSSDDVGLYKCESVYKGGTENYVFNVAITVPPILSSWFEHKDNKMEAVCKAERGKPGANITWSHQGNSSSVETQLDSEGFFTVESRLVLLEGMDTKNLSCVISHPYWKEEQILVPKPTEGSLWPIFLTLAVILFVIGLLLLLLKILRQCRQSATSPSKSPATEVVEEVEPYASYCQRVNSIYNSSADLFT